MRRLGCWLGETFALPWICSATQQTTTSSLGKKLEPVSAVRELQRPQPQLGEVHHVIPYITKPF
jgi:hypothetical protein